MSDLVDQYQQAKARSEMTNAAQASAYLDMLFELVDWEPHHRIALRPIGEKTAGHGAFGIPPRYIAPHGRDREGIKAEVHQHITNWAKAGIAAYVLPAVLKEESAEAGAVEIVTAICCDLDRGDTHGALDYAAQRVGKPSMVVESGGVTQEGAPKLHAYWRLSEPTTDIQSTMLARQALVDKISADPALGIAAGGDKERGRVHQPIRIAGSVHCKGEPRPVRVIYQGAHQVELGEFLEGMGELQRKPGLPVPVRNSGSVESGQFPFGPGAIDPNSDPTRLFQSPVLPEGASGIDRWQAFTNGIGWLIRMARDNAMPYPTVLGMAEGIADKHLGKGWEPARVKRELDKLLKVDFKNNGPLPDPAARAAKKQKLAHEETAEHFGADMWGDWETKPRSFIVKGMLMMGAPHMLAAEGGAGKTYALLDLVVKVADPQPGETWLGMPINAQHCGPVWMFTTEDDVEELRRRFKDLGHKDRVQRAAKSGRLVVIPTINTRRGSFTLVARERDGTTRHSDAWENWLRQMESGEVPALVIVDTTNGVMHGDENNATEVGEFIRTAMQVCGRFGAGFLATHHVRKLGDDPIRTEDDMLNAIRGSGALVAGMRGVIGIWHDADYQEVLPMLGLPPHQKQLYQMALVKKNNNEFLNERRHLVRHQSAGFLVDATKEVRTALAREDAAGNGELVAYVRHLVECAEDQGRPLTAADIVRKRKLYLPAPYGNAPKGEVSTAIDALLNAAGHVELTDPARVKSCIVRAGSRYAAGLDVNVNGGGFERPAWSALKFDATTTRLLSRNY